ncbi:uncharacterized protein MELLADRAFT_123977 [Melampsora larici-populina 98AG31]|uniref:Phosphatidylglycerol/phosphatidylinositol transfer protein n=1 Tax=Melampsora larici-populina (strain 98AG31 / pathotype 3-4-7) TaxID=747676 RepID=F4R9B3_MELLP|nr:uncharacterized protein MELLADRAFT_123977 [Melampsora larici-populina 98AG31]EGG10957.1 hypothetical protein MELLADRAFT_123977 [Melampsora larici-populina 98AG31]
MFSITVFYSLLLVCGAQARWTSDLLQSDMLTRLSERLSSSDPQTQTIWSFNNCGLETDAITIDKFEVSPDPPKPGKKLIITASGTANERIQEGAYADVVVKLGLIKLLHKQFDVCEELSRNANATLQCPIEPGQHTMIYTAELPREIPPAKFIVQARAYTQDDADMACADVKIDFSKPDKTS